MPPVVLGGIRVALLTGPMILGFMWSYLLYGVLVVQVYMYNELFPNDRKGIKAFVWVVFFFETLFTILITSGAWSMFGSGWGDVDILVQLNWSWGPLPLVGGIVGGLVQGFYIWRIWRLTNKYYWPIAIGLVWTMQQVGLWWYSIKWNIALWHTAELKLLEVPISISHVGNAVTDIIITIALTSTFLIQKRRTKFAETNGMLNRLIRLSIETGALTTITATGDAIMWIGWSRFNMHFAFFLVIAKLYSNVLLATLNCRHPIFLVGTKGWSTVNGSRSGDATLQTAFWSEPQHNTGKVSGVNVNTPAVSRTGVQVSHSVYVDGHGNSDTIVMRDFNDADDDLEKTSGGKL
ncbi:hypothetical protein C8R45DRAFT_1039039 [Mycena sanguinolenta]|nr:hypothetical protein C8R45DRAFT_1039039 [Mycena sanguinolenta]